MRAGQWDRFTSMPAMVGADMGRSREDYKTKELAFHCHCVPPIPNNVMISSLKIVFNNLNFKQ